MIVSSTKKKRDLYTILSCPLTHAIHGLSYSILFQVLFHYLLCCIYSYTTLASFETSVISIGIHSSYSHSCFFYHKLMSTMWIYQCWKCLQSLTMNTYCYKINFAQLQPYKNYLIRKFLSLFNKKLLTVLHYKWQNIN